MIGIRTKQIIQKITKCPAQAQCEVKTPRSTADIFHKGPESFRGPF